MDYKYGKIVDYNGYKAEMVGMIPAFFVAGKFPDGINNIKKKYLDLNFNKKPIGFDTILIKIENKLVRVNPSVLKEIKKKKQKKEGK